VLHRRDNSLTNLMRVTYEFDKLVFASELMVDVCNLARKAAATDLPVLIQGETGTGKELMARAVHFFGKRKTHLFLAQNCGTLSDELLQSELFGHRRGAFTGAISDRLGLFPAADGGTVFLDEISEVSPEVTQRLQAHPFPGNVRELENELRRMVALAGDGEFLSLKHMSPEFARLFPANRADAPQPDFLKGRNTLKEKVESLEAHLVSQCLLRHKWNHSRAARELGISRVGLANKIKRYKLDHGDVH
jgi:transcriptional regulator with PAS, ATPase and Fis domain